MQVHLCCNGSHEISIETNYLSFTKGFLKQGFVREMQEVSELMKSYIWNKSNQYTMNKTKAVI